MAIKKFILLLLVLCCAVFAQVAQGGLPTIAVLVIGGVDDNINRMLNTEMTDALIDSKRYRAVERSDVFLAQLAAERKKQNSGSVDSTVSKVGKAFGVDYLCIVSVSKVLSKNQVSARIIDVKTLEVTFIGKAYGYLIKPRDLVQISNEVVKNMFGGHVVPQSKDASKIAVYVAYSNGPLEVKNALNTEILVSLVHSGRYKTIERSDVFLAQVAKEHKMQRSGPIDEDQIREIGRQAGVEYVCVAEIVPHSDESQISTRILGVETWLVPTIGKSYSTLKTTDELERVSKDVVKKMFDKFAPPPPSSSSFSSSSSPDGIFGMGFRLGLGTTSAYETYKHQENTSEGYSDFNLSWHAGLDIEMALNDWFHLRTGTIYIAKGAGGGGDLYLHYLEFPFLASIRFGEKDAFNIAAGPYYSILLGVNGEHNDIYEDTDYGLSFVMGWGVWNNDGVYGLIAIFYDYGLKDINKKSYFSTYNRTFGVTCIIGGIL